MTIAECRIASLLSKAATWGDEVDEDENTLPPRTETAPDENGVITITEFKFNDKHQKIKVIKRVRRYTQRKRVYAAVAERRKTWVPFGVAADPDANLNITYCPPDNIKMEDPNAGEKEEKPQSVFDGKQSIITCRLCGKIGDHWTRFCPYKGLGGKEMEDMDLGDEGEEEEEKKEGGRPGAAGGGGYVPPHLRGGLRGASGDGRSEPAEEESTSIRVTNLSDDAREEDIRELFSAFGHVSRVFLAKDKVTFQSRGFAFVSFANRKDAERAMEKLQGYGYAHLILKLEWAQPSKRDAGKEGGLAGNSYVSGYGKALPQGLGDKR